MANRTIKVYGNNHAAGTALIVSWNGSEVYNATLSASVVDFADCFGGSAADEELFEFTYNNADDTAESANALSVTISTGGEASIGAIYDISNNDNANYDTYPAGDGKPPVIDIGGKWYWAPAVPLGIYDDGVAANAQNTNCKINRDSFQINGADHALNSADHDTGYRYQGYAFHLNEDDVFTCNVRVAKVLVTNPNPGKKYGWV